MASSHDVLSIHIISAENITPRDLNGSSDCFAILRLGDQEVKTRVIKKSLNPEWRERFELKVTNRDTDCLHVTLWDYDRFSPKDFEGQFDLQLKNLPSHRKLSQVYTLGPREGKNDRVSGTVRMEVTYLDAGDRLSLCLLEGKTLFELDEILGFTPDVNVGFSNGELPLFTAARVGNLEYVRRLKEAGADVNGRIDTGETAVVAALMNKHIEVAEWLFANGANATNVADNGWTVLHAAARCDNARMIKYVHELGCDVNAVDMHRHTALHHAAGWGESVLVVEYLLMVGASPSAQDIDGDTPRDLCENDEIAAVLKAAEKKETGK